MRKGISFRRRITVQVLRRREDPSSVFTEVPERPIQGSAGPVCSKSHNGAERERRIDLSSCHSDRPSVPSALFDRSGTFRILRRSFRSSSGSGFFSATLITLRFCILSHIRRVQEEGPRLLVHQDLRDPTRELIVVEELLNKTVLVDVEEGLLVFS